MLYLYLCRKVSASLTTVPSSSLWDEVSPLGPLGETQIAFNLFFTRGKLPIGTDTGSVALISFLKKEQRIFNHFTVYTIVTFRLAKLFDNRQNKDLSCKIK